MDCNDCVFHKRTQTTYMTIVNVTHTCGINYVINVPDLVPYPCHGPYKAEDVQQLIEATVKCKTNACNGFGCDVPECGIQEACDDFPIQD